MEGAVTDCFRLFERYVASADAEVERLSLNEDGRSRGWVARLFFRPSML